MSKKTLSIIVPSYNMEKYLPKCLGSLIVSPELMERLEVFVVNDGSTDRTSEIAHEFAKMWPRTFVVIDKENGNYGSCVNAALSRVSGKFVKMLDADDSYVTKNFAAFVCFLEDIDVDLVISDFEYVDESGTQVGVATYELPDGSFDFGMVSGRFCSKVQMQAVAYRTENLHRINYIQTEGISYTDQEWMFRPMGLVSKAVYFRKIVYRYLRGRNGQTVDISVLRKNRWMVLRITFGLACAYENDLDVVSKAGDSYLKQRLLEQLHIAYSLCLLEPVQYEKIEDLRCLDKFLYERLHGLYLQMEGFVSRNAYGFRFVRAWRHGGPAAAFSFFAYRLTCRLRRLIRLFFRRAE